MAEYNEEQYWNLYENLPPELQEIIFSNETAENIFNICVKNGVEDGNTISEISKFVGQVLMGLIPPEEFQATIELELNLNSKIAKNISRDIEAFIFIPIKPILAKLYEKTKEETIKKSPTENNEKEIKKIEETKKEETKENKKDFYREPIE